MATQKSHQITYNEVVAAVPYLAPEEQAGLLKAISSMLAKTLSATPEKHSLLELEGLGVELWAKENVEAYIKTERGTWN